MSVRFNMLAGMVASVCFMGIAPANAQSALPAELQSILGDYTLVTGSYCEGLGKISVGSNSLGEIWVNKYVPHPKGEYQEMHAVFTRINQGEFKGYSNNGNYELNLVPGACYYSRDQYNPTTKELSAEEAECRAIIMGGGPKTYLFSAGIKLMDLNRILVETSRDGVRTSCLFQKK